MFHGIESLQGPICKHCGREYFRGRDGLCYACWEKENEFEIRVPEDVAIFLPQTVIRDIVHRSGKEG